jgi:hypothetical protein
MRPTFETVVPLPKVEVQKRISQQLDADGWRWESHSFDGYFEMHVPKNEVRYWSPHLSISMDERDGATHIHGRFAPRQDVWTLVWVLYLAFAFTALFALLFWLAAWHASQSQWRWMWVLTPLSLLGLALLYVVNFVGQSWSNDQIHSLRAQWDELSANALGVNK